MRRTPARLVALVPAALLLGLPAALAAQPAPAAAAPPTAPAPLAGPARWADSARRAIEAASTRGDAAGVAAARAVAERALVAFPDDALLLHYQGYALYREAQLRAAAGPSTPAAREATAALWAQADSVLERSAARRPLAETLALRSAVLGRRAGEGGPLAAMRYGRASGEAMAAAAALAPDNPRVLLLRGVGAMFTPAMWGGGLDRAERDLTRAATRFADDHPAPPLPAWGRAEVYAWLGQLYEKQGKADRARAAYQQAVAADSTYAWVRYGLLPALDRAAAGAR